MFFFVLFCFVLFCFVLFFPEEKKHKNVMKKKLQFIDLCCAISQNFALLLKTLFKHNWSAHPTVKSSDSPEEYRRLNMVPCKVKKTLINLSEKKNHF